MQATFIGPTDIIIDGMGLCRYDEHIKAWKWFCFQQGHYRYEPKYSNRIVYGVML